MKARKANSLLAWLRRAGAVCGVVVATGWVGAFAAAGDIPADEEALAQFSVGVYLLESGQADRAIEPLAYAWRASEHAPHVGARLAEAYYAVRDITRAELIADDVLKTDPEHTDVLQLKARICYARRDVPAATAYLERARNAGAASFETERLLASLYAETGETAKAIESLERCVALEPSIAHLHALLGELLVVEGRTEQAEGEFRAALALEPDNTRALQSLISLMEVQGRLGELAPLLEPYAAEEDAAEAILLKLAEAYLEAGRAEDGVHLLAPRRQAGSLSPEGLILLGRLYYESEQYADAIGVFGPMYDHSGKSPELARILGELYLKTGNADRARNYYEAAISAEPDDYRNYMALFFAQSEEFTGEGPRIELTRDETADLLEMAAERVSPDDFEGNYTVGMAFSSVDSLEAARGFLSRANELKPGDRSTLFNLAAVHEKRGDLEFARDLLDALYAQMPEDAAVANFYGYVLAEMGSELDRAEGLVRKALEKEPENGYFIDSLGWIYYQRGDYKNAVIELERSLRIVGDDPVILEHLGDAYAALARYGDALAAYRQSDSLQEANPKLREKIESTERRVQ